MRLAGIMQQPGECDIVDEARVKSELNREVAGASADTLAVWLEEDRSLGDEHALVIFRHGVAHSGRLIQGGLIDSFLGLQLSLFQANGLLQRQRLATGGAKYTHSAGPFEGLNVIHRGR